jgi:hypothetical protein
MVELLAHGEEFSYQEAFIETTNPTVFEPIFGKL